MKSVSTNEQLEVSDFSSYSIAAFEKYHRGYFLEAILFYRKAVNLKRDSAFVWQNYGVMLRKAGLAEEAIEAYKRALLLKPDLASCWSNLGNAYSDLDCFQDAIKAHQIAVDANPSDTNFTKNKAISLRDKGEFKKAETIFKALQSNPENSSGLEWELAICLLYQRRFKEAWPYYESRFKAKSIRRPTLNLPRWSGEKVAGLRVLILEEQGYGDIIFASRFIKSLSDDGLYPVLCCRTELHGIMKKSGARKIIATEDIDEKKLDCYIDLMSLLSIYLERKDKSHPPVTIHFPMIAKKGLQNLSTRNNKMKIGLVWSGSRTFADNKRRSLSFDFYISLLSIPNTQFFSLQKGESKLELGNSSLSPLVIDLSQSIESFSDTATALSQLDMLITVDTSVAHLAGSLNLPVFTLLQYKPYWIWGMHGEQTEYYPSMRLIRQPRHGDWASVKIMLQEKVEKFVQEKRMDIAV